MRTLLISLDGTRADALKASNHQVLRDIVPYSVYTFDGFIKLTDGATTETGPGHASMLSGQPHNIHQVYTNTDAINGTHDLVNYPFVFEPIRDLNPNLSIGYYAGVGQMVLTQHLAAGVFNETFFSGSDSLKATYAANAIDQDYEIIYLHLSEQDHQGHLYGYSTDVYQYMNAINNNLNIVKTLVDKIQSRVNFLTEDWMYIICSDHGGVKLDTALSNGNLGDHGGDTIDERNIPIIVSSLNVTPQRLEAVRTNWKFEYVTDYQNTPRLMDVGVTLADRYGVDVSSGYGGTSLL